MKVKYINSACIEIDCNGFKILTDPWFTQGVFDGSWFHYNKIDAFEHISKPDIIYVSHIHPDHYDSIFLKKIFKKFGKIPVLIPDLSANYLLFKGKSDGLDLTPTRHFKNSKVEIFIEEQNTGSPSDIDSALIVRDIKNQKTLLNLNDCIYDKEHVDKIHGILSKIDGGIDFLALAYTGAGPYPQTFYNLKNNKAELIKEGEKKKSNFFERYHHYLNCFPAKYNLPFAGEYLLGGHLAKLNKYRGVSDAFEIKAIDPNAVVLNTGGYVDTNKDEIFNERISLYSEEYIETRIKEVSEHKMDYEKEININFEKINFLRLIKAAAQKALKKSEIESSYSFIFSITNQEQQICQKFMVDTASAEVKILDINKDIELLEYSEIIIDYRYMYGLLSTIYHWNNAEVGSQYFTRRMPADNFNIHVQNYLNFFTIA